MDFFKFWCSIFILGMVFYPFTSFIFKKFNDRGWLFSKILGLVLSSWTIWLLSYLRILEYSKTNSYIIIFIFAIINIFILLARINYSNVKKNSDNDEPNKKRTFKQFIKDILNIKNYTFKNIDSNAIKKILIQILISELLFMACLGIWVYIKGFDPKVTNSTEQFMDYGYINATMNTKYMPTEDIWLSGNSINYYYYGQYVSGFILKISNLTVSQGYNLINALIAALTFVLPYSIGYNLFKSLFDKFSNKEDDKYDIKKVSKTVKNKKSNSKNEKKINIELLSKILPLIVAIFIGISSSIGGTLHYPIYRWLSENPDDYTYVDETRYIGYKPDTEDRTATEVPAYSSIVGDLHAHYIDLIFSFTTLALLLQYFYKNKDTSKLHKTINLILLGMLLGIEKMTNYWNFPIYIVIIASVVIVKDLVCDKFSFEGVLNTILSLIGIAIVEEIVTLPFTADLVVNSTKVLFTGVMSPFYKLLVKWGLQTFCVILFFIVFFVIFNKSKKESNTTFKEYLNEHLSDLYVIIIGVCAIGLVILPEIVYLKDIYGDEFKRFNTMFKLTYQAFVLFSISTNYIIFKLMLSKKISILYTAICLLVINASTFGYGIDAITTNYKDAQHVGVSAETTEAYIKEELPKDYEAIKWIRENLPRDKVILEASQYGASYSKYARISVFTGNPTVIGWTYHEWIWRSNEDYTIPNELAHRDSEVKRIYYANSEEDVTKLVEKYNVSYIYLGELEYETYSHINIDLLKELYEVVYNSDNIYIFKVK